MIFMGCEFFIDPTVEDTGLSFNNLNEIYSYMFKNFTQKSDMSVHGVDDYWQAPKETLDLKSGDCEDFAIFMMYHLEKIGIDTTLCGIKTEKGTGHAMVQIGMTLYDTTKRGTCDVNSVKITQSMGLKYALQRCISHGSY